MKCFVDLMQLLQFQNLLLWIYDFFTINKQVTIRSIIMQAHKNFVWSLLKLIEYIFSAFSICSNPCIGRRIKIYIFSVINLCWWTHIYYKNYQILTISTAWMWKLWSSVKCNSISRIFVPINTSIFGQTNCPK